MIENQFEEEILKYALQKENYESFANLLKKILPAYTKWTWGQEGLYRKYFNEWQESGFTLMPNHYYSPVPDVGRIDETAYRKQTKMLGIDLKATGQIEFLDKVCASFKGEYSLFPDRRTGLSYEFHFNNGVFERIDAEILYCMIRHLKPKQMIEIGSGYSTLVSAAACEMNRKLDNIKCDFSAIEPYPNKLFESDIPGLSKLVGNKLEEIDIEIFDVLDEGDILFIDSSHVLKVGSDVQYEYLEILPRLKPGVVIHIHDIFLPAEYPKSWIKEEHVFWNEQYLLQAFLSFNDSFEVLWAGSFMHLNHHDKLKECFTGYSPEACWPGSFWIKRVK